MSVYIPPHRLYIDLNETVKVFQQLPETTMVIYFHILYVMLFLFYLRTHVVFDNGSYSSGGNDPNSRWSLEVYFENLLSYNIGNEVVSDRFF